MKRRTFAHSFHSNSRRRLDTSASDDKRVQILHESTQDFVRSGQIIGSPCRAIEELVRNSITHGGAKEVIITIGTCTPTANRQNVRVGRGGLTTFMEVTDDGVGIDVDSCRDFIGTQYCSSNVFHAGESMPRDAEGAMHVRSADKCRGESLKALAALSVEFRVETTCSKPSSTRKLRDREKHQKGYNCKRALLSAPSKPRRQRNYASSPLLQWHDNNMMEDPSTYITSDKVVRDGQTIEFRSSIPSESSKVTGTKIQLYGLFHKHGVRLIHHQKMKHASSISHSSSSSSSIHSSDQFHIGQARAIVQMLALAFPNVCLKLYPTRSAEHPMATWERPPSFEYNSWMTRKAMKERFLQFCGIHARDMSNVSMFDVSFVEGSHEDRSLYVAASDHTRSVRKIDRSQFKYIKTEPGSYNHNMWSISGVLIRKETNNCEDLETASQRNRQEEVVFVNQRNLKNHYYLCDSIHKQLCGLSGSGGHSWSFLLYISCPSKDVDLVLDENKSYFSLRQKDRLNLILRKAIEAPLGDHTIKIKQDRSMVASTTEHSHMDSVDRQRIRGGKSDSNATATSTRPNIFRIVHGKQEKRLQNPVSLEEESDKAKRPMMKESSEASPFSNAFTQTKQKQRSRTKIRSPHFDAAFDTAFIPTVPEGVRDTVPVSNLSTSFAKINAKKDSVNDGMMWSRKRLKAFDSELKDLSKSHGVSKPIKLSKDMLSRAQFVATLDKKFILVIMDGVLCAIDQHAADERVGLECLENALESNISTHRDGDNIERFDLSKAKNISVNNIFTTKMQKNVKPIPLTSSQVTAILENEPYLRNWKFGFELDKAGSCLYLNEVPRICDKVATTKDFLQFIQALACHTSDASLVKPQFVKRVLASYACRYAMMFGDEMKEDECVQLIASLAKCDLSFCCAHGRPSVAPLIDLNTSFCIVPQSPGENANKEISTMSVDTNVYVPIRFRMQKDI